ncbi:TetR/AcrR family transcriptional regulator [Acidomonas methanolica]|uniref:Transcriptional regulator TetR n=1 Tax=Acidomonas methanolica NBRC 104435 TaxID=1231351 RepID=A0A023D209_ACIMT|nr:TetR/AcrR family transcriptional regulator [Acidomonas methanolica]MBU2655357.1 TetR/AcrR family transcriptional regulator [Acidomonas methanolica]TCS23774.1 TetR family transcriptional regulator [Acidomonas methanolica]GAJ27861.1 transcriptional regulator TetR [Acidomonas methanolica NBRC 104435]GBQ46560.1 TetR family transcriptional regulator [Acidomonas methanolica]GEL00245.1 TetR family transcriptional regulator [Acidomonas methanolica NBRC 104435]
MSELKDRPYHHGDLRRTLIDTALAMLAADQNWTFTLREVARRAGVSHAAPYKHFRDRDVLLCELARIGFARLAQVMTTATSSPEFSPRRKFLEGAQACIDFALRNPGLYRLMFSSDADKTADPALHAAAMSAFGLLLGVLEDGQKTGCFRPAPIGAQAAAGWAQVHGLALLALNGQLLEEKVGAEPVRGALDVLLDGLCLGN